MAEQTVTRARAIKRPLLWACGVLMLAGVPVQITGTGIDIFVLLTAGTVLFALERTLGDAVAEFVGPVGAALLFCAMGGIGFGYVLTESGQHTAKRFLFEAESRGYQPLVFTPERTKDEDKRYKSKQHPADSDQDVVVRSPPPPPVAPDVSASETAPPPVGGVRVSPGLFSSWREKEIPLARLTVSPDIVMAGETVHLQVRFVGGAVTLRGPLVFFVNGEEIARGGPDENGVTSVQTTARYPGLYTAGVRLPPGTRAKTPADVSFTVLPSGR